MLDYGSAGTYNGWDRFMRITDQKWRNTAGTTNHDRFVYTYDRNSNRVSKDVTPTVATSGKDEYYEYDALDRVGKWNRGNLSGGTITDASANYNQQWSKLDALGNWQQFKYDANGGGNGFTTQDRTHTKANELTTLAGGGWQVSTYDAAGNMTAAATPLNETILQKYVWDAWNRLVKVTNALGSQIQKYTYDGIGRRQTRYTNSNDDTNYFYYDAARRMLENWKQVSTGGPVTIYEQWVMSELGAKLPAVRFRDADGNGTFDETQHYTWDANGNITAMLSTGGSVVERYTYDAYGAPKYWSGNWMTQLSNPAYSNRILFGGAYYQDNTTGLYYADARYYHPTLGRFISRDPLLTNFQDGVNLYQYVRGNPVNDSDPYGEMTGGGARTSRDSAATNGIPGKTSVGVPVGMADDLWANNARKMLVKAEHTYRQCKAEGNERCMRNMRGVIKKLVQDTYGRAGDDAFAGYWKNFAEGGSDGFYAWANGAIPFADPFGKEWFYDPCDKNLAMSKSLGHLSRNLWMAALIPNVGTWAQAPRTYEAGSMTISNAQHILLSRLSVLERGNYLLKTEGISVFVPSRLGPYANTVFKWSGLTPGGSLTYIFTVDAADSYHEKQNECGCQ